MTNLIERLRDDEANSFGGLYCAKRELVHEAATALSEAKAENERLTRERDKWFREAEERADACSLLIREHDGLREALKPFAECKVEAPYGDDAKTRLRIKIGPDAFTADQFVGPTLGHFRRARAALNPKGGDNGEG